ncbi:AraC family transcriptional regulator [Miniphocaeibacter massiliensis]|uniref:AraC family transcriptional regulator n=1 Tax=Miniphocaeibacter massiliensis TaxID=2041841 RepID=UPI000C1BBC09|nr:AraC family transcriptional regulator [Miniphocaeibacter massiliensis]
MDWVKSLNKALEYIEENITGDIDYEKIAKICYCSQYNFQRMFSYMANVTLSEYIRRRKMSLAVIDLQMGNKILDVALKYGYNSPTSFNRAFKSIHGIAPSKVKEDGVIIKSYPPLSFQIIIKGVEEMNYKIEQKKEMRILGVSVPLEKDMEKNMMKIPSIWTKCMEDGTIDKLVNIMNEDTKALLGVNVCNEEDNWRYFIAVASSIENEEFEEYIIPEATWAIFEGEGTGISIQNLMQKVFTEWLPNSGYEYANLPDLEVYYDPNPQNTKYEVWLPIVKK